ncbi:SAGA complex subunit spt3 [Dictyocoela muelleri]|nr:SAGA complex subunit spt3 [Dictyocoela muelleri]
MKYLYTDEIKLMMFTAGDISNPFETTAKYIEIIIKNQILELLKKAKKIMKIRNSKIIDVEDILFVLRKQPGKMMRLLNFINTKNINEFIKSESFEEIAELNFSWILPGTANVIDFEYRDKLERVDKMTVGMTKDEYEHFAEARHASFTYKKINRFKAFIRPYKAKESAIDILGVICSDIVYYLVFNVLKDKKDNSGITADQIKKVIWNIIFEKDCIY